MPIEREDLAMIVKAIEAPTKALVERTVTEAIDAHVKGTLLPIIEEMAQRDVLVENNLVGRVLAQGWQGLSNEAWKRYVLHEAERIMEEEEEERLEEFLDSETVEEVKRVVEKNDPAPVVKKITKRDAD